MPQELKERLIEWAAAINLVADFFKDRDKTLLWFSISNPFLGDQTPKQRPAGAIKANIPQFLPIALLIMLCIIIKGFHKVKDF